MEIFLFKKFNKLIYLINNLRFIDYSSLLFFELEIR